MAAPVRKMTWSGEPSATPDPLLSREWLVTNGLGGYASGTVGGVLTRRYHGLLVAALPAPLGRTVMLTHVAEQLVLPDGRVVHLTGEEREDALALHGAAHLREFRLEAGLPVWRYDVDGFVVEKRVLMPYRQNTVHLAYRLASGAGTIRLRLRPAVHFRSHEAPVSAPLDVPYTFSVVGERFELHGPAGLPALRLGLVGEAHTFTLDGHRVATLRYRLEAERGYDAAGELWSPGYFSADLADARDVVLVGSTEAWEEIGAFDPAEALAAERERRQRLLSIAPQAARTGIAAELVLAADQFIVTPAGRLEDAARARAVGDEVRTVIAGYHWFTDWGRDTMISLEGLALCTGRHREAGYILRTFADYVRHGLIPNLFPDQSTQGLYHTADATLWFFHALSRYVETTGDRTTLRRLLPVLRDIIDQHLRGTRFGIGVDPDDGLLRQGEQGYALTWMDARMDDWVVTPRRGKAVELTALWYNALRLMERWLREESGSGTEGAESAERMAEHAARARASFNQRFWYAEGGHLYDVVDGEHGDDAACRPNQIFAISLAHPVLEPERWVPVLQTVRAKLLTPVGLRSLAPDDPAYRPGYFGDLRTRDAAYHQGTVWAWLIGPFIDAWLKVHPHDRAGARRFLEGFQDELGEYGLGTIAEIFDAEPPFTPRGCIAQAWSVAEVLRCWLRTEPGSAAMTPY